MRDRPRTRAGRFLAASLLLLVVAPPARALATTGSPPVITGSQYAGELAVVSNPLASGSPIYAANPFFPGNNDVMLSPGQTYPVADFGTSTVVTSAGPSTAPIYISSGPIGVSNPAGGSFNGGFIAAGPSTFSFALNDFNSSVQVASAVIGSSVTTYSTPNGFSGSIGAYLGVSGNVPTAAGTTYLGLVMNITDMNPNSPLHNLPTQTIFLGDYNTSRFRFTPLASAQYTSFTQGGDGTLTHFEAAGVDIFSTGPLPAGDTFTVTATLAAYGDPAYLYTIDISNFPSLIPDLPNFVVVAGVAPEPASLVLLGAGLLGLAGYTAARRLRRARAA